MLVDGEGEACGIRRRIEVVGGREPPSLSVEEEAVIAEVVIGVGYCDREDDTPPESS